MTQLAITPNYDKKTARFRGTVAAGEHIEVRILGGGEWIQTGLRLRVCDCVRTLAEFPQRDEQGGYTVGSWQQDGYDAICELNLNTVQMQKAVRGCPAISLVFVLDNPDEDTMYFTDCHEINGWRRDAGDELPYDLDAFPGLIDSWKAQLAGLKLEATQTEYGVRLVVCDGLTPEKGVEVRHGRDGRDGMDGEVTAEQMKAAIAIETDRAKAAEQANATAVENEMTRAKAAEQTNATAIANEVARAKAAETANNNLIVREINRSNAADKSLAEDIAATDGIAKDAQGKANILIGNDSGKSARTIAGEEMAKIVADAPAAYDTLKEIADYITEDQTGAAAMAASIAENKSAVEAVEERVTELEEGGGGGVDVVTPDDSATEGQAADAQATYEALVAKADASKLADYLPLSGGTMTGDLTTSSVGGFSVSATLSAQSTEKTQYLRQSINFVPPNTFPVNSYLLKFPFANGTLALTNNLAVTPWSAFTSYSVGTIVVYNGATYRCTTAHTSGSAWDATKWTADAVAVNSQLPDLTPYATTESVTQGLSGKVDKVDGKGLSTNDFTNAEKTKLASINLAPYAKSAEVIPRYGYVAATVASGVLTLAPYSQNALTSDGTAFTVTMGGGTGKVRDCVFVVTAGETAPTITWGAEFHPRTDAATDFACVAGATNVYWITEYAEGQFAVAGWQVTAGGSEVAE